MTTQPATRPSDDRSLGDLLGELSHEIITLVRQELNLAKAEMSQKIAHVTKQVVLLAIGGVLGFGGALTILAAIVLILAHLGLPAWAAALLVGLVTAGIGGALISKGVNALKHEDLTPRQTLQTLQEIKNG